MLPGMATHQAANRTAWTGFAAAYAEAAERHWAATEPSWGTVGRPERDLGLLGEVHGLDVLELGGGTAYWSARSQQRGARPIGLDLTPAPLATARRMQVAHGQRFPPAWLPSPRGTGVALSRSAPGRCGAIRRNRRQW
jgi:hypothetical protein